MRISKLSSASIIIFALSLILLVPRPLWAATDLLCSTFPIYLFTKNISEGRDVFAPALMLNPAQGCPHDYAPTPAELEKLSQATVLVINGRGMESFLGQALKVAKPDLKIVDASGPEDLNDPLAALLLSRDDLLGKEELHGHEDGPNPHLFASPGAALWQVSRIAEGLAALDPDGAALYRANAARLTDELRGLAALFSEAGREWNQPKVVASHGIFDFMAKDAGFIVAEHIEEEDGVDPSPARLAQLITVVKEQEVKAVLVDPHGNIKLARALGAEAKIPVALIDPVDSGPPDAPPDYYQKVMLTDLKTLTELFAAPPEPEKKPQKGKGKK